MDDEGGTDVPEVDDVDLEEGEISDEAPDAEEPLAKEPSAEAQPEDLKSNGSCLLQRVVAPQVFFSQSSYLDNSLEKYIIVVGLFDGLRNSLVTNLGDVAADVHVNDAAAGAVSQQQHEADFGSGGKKRKHKSHKKKEHKEVQYMKFLCTYAKPNALSLLGLKWIKNVVASIAEIYYLMRVVEAKSSCSSCFVCRS